MYKIYENIKNSIEINPHIVNKLIVSLLVLIALWLIRILIIRLVRRNTGDVKVHYNWRKYSAYTSAVLTVLFLGIIWFSRFQSVSTFVGLISAGLAIALRDLIVNMAGWLFIVWRRPFTVGDRIQIGAYSGDVIDLRIFQFTLLEIGNWVHADQSTGRVIHIPNGRVFRDLLANYSKGFKFIWNEIEVLVTFESNWKKAKEIMTDIVKTKSEHLSAQAEQKVHEASRKFMIMYRKLTPIVYTSVKDSGVLLTIRYLTEPRKRRGSEEAIWEEILDSFDKHDDIEFAYPTTRFYNRKEEEGPPD